MGNIFASSNLRQQTWKTIPQTLQIAVIDKHSISVEDLKSIRVRRDNSHFVTATPAGVFIRVAELRKAARICHLEGCEGAAYNLVQFLDIKAPYAVIE